MLGQAAGFAVLAAISPASLLVMAVFLGSANPRRTALAYVAGAMLMTVAMAVAVLYLIRGFGLDQPRQHDPRYGLRLGLGILALAAAAVVARRERPRTEARKQGKGLLSRLTATPGPGTAFAAGLILFLPSTTFIAAVQVVATARAGVAITVAALLIVVLLTALVVWLPLLGYLAAPDATTRRLAAVNDWVRVHGRTVLVCAVAAGGAVLVVNGALGLLN